MTLGPNQDRLRRWGFLKDISTGYGPNTEAAYTLALDKLETFWPLPAPIGHNNPPSPVTPPSAFPAVARFFSETITAHEGVLSMRPSDGGNYQGGKVGKGALIGSQYGVTPPALALFRGIDPYTLTNADMKAITRDLAVAIGVKLYYDVPNFDLFPWDQIIASATDKAWGSGPGQAIKLLQRTIGEDDDGVVGSDSVNGYRAWKARVGLEEGARLFAKVRRKFDSGLPTYHLNPGWDHRTDSFLPGTPFWKNFTT
jgi:lysozyme family protein